MKCAHPNFKTLYLKFKAYYAYSFFERPIHYPSEVNKSNLYGILVAQEGSLREKYPPQRGNYEKPFVQNGKGTKVHFFRFVDYVWDRENAFKKFEYVLCGTR